MKKLLLILTSFIFILNINNSNAQETKKYKYSQKEIVSINKAFDNILKSDKAINNPKYKDAILKIKNNFNKGAISRDELREMGFDIKDRFEVSLNEYSKTTSENGKSKEISKMVSTQNTYKGEDCDIPNIEPDLNILNNITYIAGDISFTRRVQSIIMREFAEKCGGKGFIMGYTSFMKDEKGVYARVSGFKFYFANSIEESQTDRLDTIKVKSEEEIPAYETEKEEIEIEKNDGLTNQNSSEKKNKKETKAAYKECYSIAKQECRNKFDRGKDYRTCKKEAKSNCKLKFNYKDM